MNETIQSSEESSLGAGDTSLNRIRFRAMGCENEIVVESDSSDRADAALRLAQESVAQIERKYSRYREDSVVSKINASAGSAAVEVDDDTWALLEYADQCFRASGGLFDITSGVLRRIWNFSDARVPSNREIAQVLPLIGWRRVELEGRSIRLPERGMEIDFGGIGKEYAVDVTANLLRESGIAHGFVNLGGDVRVIGPRLDGRPWHIGVAHPRAPGEVLMSVALASGALATSGDYERFFELHGRRYCHILNPRTGYPVTGLQAVSVRAESCLIAGSVCSIAMLLGPKHGPKFVAECSLPAIVVKQDGTVAGSLRA